ncbi:MAG: tRNA (N6-threonylcarbamoyladenosine(37)-N6)-methyltransferase TrmO [Actinomycetota bacterium]|nr:tRNA (N6-threonylcarbamoyladenosine(37)-N6)-methyltransferase TrmO [Actinomycetota bacterium]
MSDEKARVLKIRPVGTVMGGLEKPILALRDGELHMSESRGSGRDASRDVSEIHIRDEYAECLEGIEEFSHVIVLYWSHMVGERGRGITRVHPAGQKDIAMVGVFSTRSPARPNPICVTTVELLRRKGNVLEVRGLDAVEGSPVIDLKPYLPHYDALEEVELSEWMNELMRRFRGGD